MNTAPDNLFQRNKQWADDIKDEQSDFFQKLSKGQDPNYLWIGCSDSRVPANEIMDLPPGELFVHRNIANLVVHSDLNFMSVLQYAVQMLEVDHVVVCGHYGCGGVAAATDDQDHGLIDNWLRHIQDVQQNNADKLRGLSDDEQYQMMCELNVAEQVNNIGRTSIVQQAWKDGADLTVHGWIYSLEEGSLNDLKLDISSAAELEK